MCRIVVVVASAGYRAEAHEMETNGISFHDVSKSFALSAKWIYSIVSLCVVSICNNRGVKMTGFRELRGWIAANQNRGYRAPPIAAPSFCCHLGGLPE